MGAVWSRARVIGGALAAAVLLLAADEAVSPNGAAAREVETPLAVMGGADNPVGPESVPWRRAVGVAQEQARQLASSDSKKERKKTRKDRSGITGDAALALARAVWGPFMRGPLFDGSEPGPGLAVEEQLGKGSAIVRDKKGKKLLLAAGLPLQAKVPGGGYAPVDLGLEKRGGKFAPKRSRAPF